MATLAAQIVGGAGTGKTTRLLGIMERLIEDRGYRWDQIGFVSFTRAARGEAASRAAGVLGVPAKTLQVEGWFRTLHSVCYRALGGEAKALLSGNAESQRWVSEALGEDVTGGEGEDEAITTPFVGATAADKALQLWSIARNRLAPLESVWREAEAVAPEFPNWRYVRQVVDLYEQSKRLHWRFDFTDLLLRFAGIKPGFTEHSLVHPEGEAPSLPVWFFDEQQDTSALLNEVCKRLIETATYAYFVGDPFQSIYTFAGADPRHFMGWDYAKSDVLRTSYRCGPRILALGESILRRASDYWDREIRPVDGAPGDIYQVAFHSELWDRVDPRESWMLLARTNALAAKLSHQLNVRGVPWKSTKGGSQWIAPQRNATIFAMDSLQRGGTIAAPEWVTMLEYIPSKFRGLRLLEHGTKAKFEKKKQTPINEDAEPPDDEPEFDSVDDWREQRESEDSVSLTTLADLGASDDLRSMIGNGSWRALPKLTQASAVLSAAKRFGREALESPRCVIGTIHSVKGGEADNVVLLTTTTNATERGQLTTSGYDAERRVEYVAVTRARKNLFVMAERDERCQMRI